jgi:hypothetical protein
MPAILPDPTDLVSTGGSAGEAHSRMHGRTLDSVENILAYDVDTTGGTDCTSEIAEAISAVPEGGTVYMPAGTYNATIATSGKRLRLLGDGASTVLRASSTNPIISINGGGVAAGFYIGHMKIVNDGAGNGVELRRVHRSQVDNVLVTKAGNAGWQMYGCLLNQFNNIGTTSNETVPANGNAKYGLVLANDATLGSGCNANTFVNFVAEGCTTSPGVGIELLRAEGNVFIGGVSEGNTIGMRYNHATLVQHNWVFGTWFEANGTEISGTLTNNFIFRRDATSYLNLQFGDYIFLTGQFVFNAAVNGSAQNRIISGGGSPEGAYAGEPGSLYMDSTNGEAYVKKTGAGTTGWKAITHAA